MLQLETITASLAEGYKQLEPESFRTSAELTTERRTNKELRNRWFYTANFGMYDAEDGKEVLYFGEREANPVLANIDEACSQLINTQNYRVKSEDRHAVVDSVESGQTLRVVLSELDLEKYNDEFSFFEIDTVNYDASVEEGGLNDSQRALAERIYGSREIKTDEGTGEEYTDFDRNMEMLRESPEKVSKIKVYVLNQDYVREKAKEGAFARACWLSKFSLNSNFYALARQVNFDNDLRGVLKSAEGDDAPKTKD